MNLIIPLSFGLFLRPSLFLSSSLFVAVFSSQVFCLLPIPRLISSDVFVIFALLSPLKLICSSSFMSLVISPSLALCFFFYTFSSALAPRFSVPSVLCPLSSLSSVLSPLSYVLSLLSTVLCPLSLLFPLLSSRPSPSLPSPPPLFSPLLFSPLVSLPLPPLLSSVLAPRFSTPLSPLSSLPLLSLLSPLQPSSHQPSIKSQTVSSPQGAAELNESPFYVHISFGGKKVTSSNSNIVFPPFILLLYSRGPFQGF